jgi:D-glycero-D-manno-heptose 1,7-bisphosphate phosphatase
MLLRAATDMNLDVGRSVLVADKATDIEAGQAAGIRRLYLLDPGEPHARGTRLTTLRDLAVDLAKCGPDVQSDAGPIEHPLVRRACP